MKRLIVLALLFCFVTPLIAQETVMYKIYRAPVIGSGVRFDAYRSKLDIYIRGGGTGRFWDWINFARPVRYCLAETTQSIIDIISGDPSITDISPAFNSLDDMAVWLDSSQSNMSTAAKNILDADSCSTAWIVDNTTNRQILGYCARVHTMTQNLKKLRAEYSLQLFAADLDAKVNSLPQPVRQEISTWMTTKGLDVSWITGQTAVRQVIHYILQNINWPIVPLGLIDLK